MGLLPSPMTCDVVLGECLRQGRLRCAVVFVEETLLARRHLDPELLHKLLQAVGRQGALEAAPLALKLVRAGVEMPQSLLEALKEAMSAHRDWHIDGQSGTSGDLNLVI